MKLSIEKLSDAKVLVDIISQEITCYHNNDGRLIIKVAAPIEINEFSISGKINISDNVMTLDIMNKTLKCIIILNE